MIGKKENNHQTKLVEIYNQVSDWLSSPQAVTEVKKFFYKEESPYKMVQPFISLLSLFDILGEGELINILSYFVKSLEEDFIVPTSNNKFVKSINLSKVELPFSLMNYNGSDDSIVVSSEEIKKIFNHFHQLNLKENEFVFYLNPFSLNDYNQKIAEGGFSSELGIEIFNYLKQIQKFVQTSSPTKNLNQIYIDEDSDIKTVIVGNVKFFRNIFSKILVDEYLVDDEELVNILQEFYLIPKEKIKLVEEDFLKNKSKVRMTRIKKDEFKQFISDLLNHSSETN